MTQSSFARWQDPKRQQDAVAAHRLQQLEELRQKMHTFVIQELGPILYDQRVSENELRRQVEEQLHRALGQERLALTAGERQAVVQSVFDDVLGYGPIDQLLRNPGINEIMVNGPGHVFIERNGRIEITDVRFVDESHLRRIIDKIVSQVGRRVDEATPMVDARLPDGSRVNVIIHPLAIGGPYLTIRRFATDPFTVDDLIAMGSLTEQSAHFLDSCVRGRLNVVVSGGTGTGKTTLLNVVSSFIPAEERIITIEDSKELQLQQPHVLSLEARPPNIEGRGEVRIRDLVRNSLRMRPDRIVVGEARGAEALDMLQAMNTGHDGSLTTVHANSPRECLQRLDVMVLMAGYDLPVKAIRQQVGAAVNVLVQAARLTDGSRKIVRVSEIVGMESDQLQLQDIFEFVQTGVTPEGRVQGQFRASGLRRRSKYRLRSPLARN